MIMCLVSKQIKKGEKGELSEVWNRKIALGKRKIFANNRHEFEG